MLEHSQIARQLQHLDEQRLELGQEAKDACTGAPPCTAESLVPSPLVLPHVILLPLASQAMLPLRSPGLLPEI